MKFVRTPFYIQHLWWLLLDKLRTIELGHSVNEVHVSWFIPWFSCFFSWENIQKVQLILKIHVLLKVSKISPENDTSFKVKIHSVYQMNLNI